MSEAPSKPASGARSETGSPQAYLKLLASWLIPGAGHFLLGQRARGIVFSLIVFVSLAVGCSLEGNLYRILPNQPLTILATFGSMGMGAPYFVLRFLLGYEGNIVGAGYEYGTAFILTAGLMNLLLVLDAWDLVRARRGTP